MCADVIHKFRGIDRLLDVIGKAEGERFLADARHGVGSHNNNRNGVQSRVGPQGGSDAVSIEFGQLDVQENTVGTQATCHFNAFPAIGGRNHFESVAVEQEAHQVKVLQVVFNNQNGNHS